MKLPTRVRTLKRDSKHLGAKINSLLPYLPLIFKLLTYSLLLVAAILKNTGHADLATSLLALGSMLGIKEAFIEHRNSTKDNTNE